MTGRGPLGTRVWEYGRVGARVGPRPAFPPGSRIPSLSLLTSAMGMPSAPRAKGTQSAKERRPGNPQRPLLLLFCPVLLFACGPGGPRARWRAPWPRGGSSGRERGTAGAGMGGAHGKERGPGRVCAGTRGAPPAAAARARPDPVTPGDSPVPWLHGPASKTPPGTSCPTMFQVAFASQKSLRTVSIPEKPFPEDAASQTHQLDTIALLGGSFTPQAAGAGALARLSGDGGTVLSI